MTEFRQVVSVLIGLVLGGTFSALRPMSVVPAVEADVPPCTPDATVDALTNALETVALERLRRSTETGFRIRPAPPWPQPADPRFEPKTVSRAFREELDERQWKGLDCREYPCLATVAFYGDDPRAEEADFTDWLVRHTYVEEGFLAEERHRSDGLYVSVALPEHPLSGADVPRVRFRLVEWVTPAAP